MKVLKTIVATAVIVFALTTVAMAGVQHFTKQSGQATGTQAQSAQPTYTVTLTAAGVMTRLGVMAAGTGGCGAGVMRGLVMVRPAGAARRGVSGAGDGGTHHYE